MITVNVFMEEARVVSFEMPDEFGALLEVMAEQSGRTFEEEGQEFMNRIWETAFSDPELEEKIRAMRAQ